MRILNIMGWLLMHVSVLILLAGCGEDTKTEYVQTTAPASTYLVEYVPDMMNATMGKTHFQIRVRTRSDGKTATGLASSMKAYPLMHMLDGRNHSAPIDPVIESGTPGTYDCTAYYVMADKSTTGMVMGYWELTVTIGSETATFYPSVGMSMGDTTLARLYGVNDLINSTSTSTLPEKRVYLLFHDGLTSGATSTFNIFIGTKETMLNFPAVSIGTVLSSTTGTWAVDGATTSLVASLDSSFATGTVAGVDKGGGHWSLSGISGLASGVATTIYVQLTVNSELKTGLTTTAPSYASFKVTPQ